MSLTPNQKPSPNQFPNQPASNDSSLSNYQPPPALGGSNSLLNTNNTAPDEPWNIGRDLAAENQGGQGNTPQPGGESPHSNDAPQHKDEDDKHKPAAGTGGGGDVPPNVPSSHGGEEPEPDDGNRQFFELVGSITAPLVKKDPESVVDPSEIMETARAIEARYSQDADRFWRLMDRSGSSDVERQENLNRIIQQLKNPAAVIDFSDDLLIQRQLLKDERIASGVSPEEAERVAEGTLSAKFDSGFVDYVYESEREEITEEFDLAKQVAGDRPMMATYQNDKLYAKLQKQIYPPEAIVSTMLENLEVENKLLAEIINKKIVDERTYPYALELARAHAIFDIVDIWGAKGLSGLSPEHKEALGIAERIVEGDLVRGAPRIPGKGMQLKADILRTVFAKFLFVENGWDYRNPTLMQLHILRHHPSWINPLEQ